MFSPFNLILCIHFIVNFENGTLSTNMAHSKLQCEMLSDTSTTVDHIITESNNMLYKGAVETFMSTFTMLAIKNKKTNKVFFGPFYTYILIKVISFHFINFRFD